MGASWPRGCRPGELCARPWGTPADRGCPWGLGCAAATGDPLLPCSNGAGGQQLLSPGVAALGCSCPLLCPQGLHLSSGQGFSPMCDYQRTVQAQPHGSPADTRGSLPACFQGMMWPLGLDPTPFQIHSGKCQVTVKPCSPPVVQMSLAVMMNCWSAAGRDPTTTKQCLLTSRALDQA